MSGKRIAPGDTSTCRQANSIHERRLIATPFFTAASLLATSSSVAAGSSGIIHFTGMIVERPCSLALDAPDAAPAR